jgi:hypothetical protein
MIAVEFFWLTLIFVFGVIGAVRGPAKELGSTAVLMLSLFALWVGWDQAGRLIVSLFNRGPLTELTVAQVKAIYYSCAILFVAFISYEGIVLQFPFKVKGLLKTAFGFFVGLFNGYLVIGTVWDVTAHANYFQPTLTVVCGPFSEFHNTVIEYLPVSLMENFSPLPMLIFGMLLLLAVIFK